MLLRRNMSNLVRRGSKSTQLKPFKSAWVTQKDPKGTGLSYYWNTETNETTALGAPKPAEWLEVQTEGGQSYFWNPETDETTALGAPKPPSVAQVYSALPFTRPQQQQSLGGSMLTYLTLGFGMTIGMLAVRIALGF